MMDICTSPVASIVSAVGFQRAHSRAAAWLIVVVEEAWRISTHNSAMLLMLHGNMKQQAALEGG